MDQRQRIIRTVQFQEVDQLPMRHAYGLMPGVLEDWHQQGLPSSVESRDDIYDYFDFQRKPASLPLSVGFDPPFEARVLEETAEYCLGIDDMGRRTRVLKEYASLSRAEGFPVHDWDSWQDYRRRLVFHERRVGPELERLAAQNVAAGHLNSLGTRGFYWFPRDLMGDEALCIAYYEQPELVADICDTWCTLIEQVLRRALGRIQLDMVHFGEDMAYRNASMVGPALFAQFIRPYYQRIRAIVDEHEVPIFSVDTDGCAQELNHWFCDCGVNFIGPNEVQAGNDVVQYRQVFGKRLAFDGGLDKRVLLDGRDAIDQMLEQTIPAMKATGGGWMICLDHRVLKGTRLVDFQHYIQRARELARW
jgi:hypothetical protein